MSRPSSPASPSEPRSWSRTIRTRLWWGSSRDLARDGWGLWGTGRGPAGDGCRVDSSRTVLSEAVMWSARFILSAAVLGTTACRRDTRPSAAPGDAPPNATAATSDSKLFPPGTVLSGDGPMLRHYLETVDTVEGAQVDVKYAPQTVFIPRDAAIRSLRGATWDGAVWRFAAAEPVIARLQPGSVMVVWGLAFRRVTAVEHIGDELVVRTEPAAFSDAVVDAHISWNAPMNMAQGVVSVQTSSP